MIRPVSRQIFLRSVLQKGFQRESKRDHDYFYFWLAGKKTRLWVKLSQGATEIRRDEIRNNARAWKVAGEDIYKILCCEHDAQKTLEIARRALA